MKNKSGLLLGGCGGVLALLCLVSFGFWLFMVIKDSGNISADEAMPGVFGSCCCGIISLGIVGLGVFLTMRAKKSAGAPPAPPASPGGFA